MNSYSIVTQDGIQLATGLDQYTVRCEAQAFATQRGEPVEYYEVGENGPIGEAEIVEPMPAEEL